MYVPPEAFQAALVNLNLNPLDKKSIAIGPLSASAKLGNK
jgi:hypothetical protein